MMIINQPNRNTEVYHPKENKALDFPKDKVHHHFCTSFLL